MDLLILAAKTLLLAIPLYIANGCALLFGGKTPLDFGKNFFDKKPLFGKGKTFKGSISGIICGSLASAAIFFALPHVSEVFATGFLELGFLLSLGAVLGDIAASFIKRRMNFERGKHSPVLDQLDFILGGLVLGLFVYTPSIIEIGLLLILTPAFHLIGNFIAFKAKKKKVSW